MLRASTAHTEDVWFPPSSQAMPPLFPLEGSPPTLPVSVGSQGSPELCPGSHLSPAILSPTWLRLRLCPACTPSVGMREAPFGLGATGPSPSPDPHLGQRKRPWVQGPPLPWGPVGPSKRSPGSTKQHAGGHLSPSGRAFSWGLPWTEAGQVSVGLFSCTLVLSPLWLHLSFWKIIFKFHRRYKNRLYLLKKKIKAFYIRLRSPLTPVPILASVRPQQDSPQCGDFEEGLWI